MSTVKAAVLDKVDGKFTIKEFELPSLDGKHVLVRVSTTTTCGTDVHIWHGELPAPFPIILGHESIGHVDVAPEGMKDFTGKPLREGDRVVWNFVEPCGRCYVCTIEGLPSACPNRKVYGITVGCGVYPYLNGCYSEAIAVGINTPIFKIENDLDDSLLSPISCALSTIIKAIDILNPAKLDKALVIGVGPLGLYSCAYLSERGVAKIVAVDMVDERLRLAEEFGADATINLNHHKDLESVRKALQDAVGHEGATLAIEVAGNPKAVDMGVELLARAGRMAVVGSVVQGTCQFNPLFFVRKQATLRGSLGYEARHMLEGIRFVEETVDKYPFKKLVGKSYRLPELEQALTDMKEKRIIKGAVRIAS